MAAGNAMHKCGNQELLSRQHSRTLSSRQETQQQPQRQRLADDKQVAQGVTVAVLTNAQQQV
jgi:hypothetical protein